MADLELRRNFNSTFTSERKSISYPYIFIPKFGKELALVVTLVRKGELPICVNDKGVLKQIGSVSLSALELKKILSVFPFQFVFSATDSRKVKTIPDMMEVLSWMLSSSQ